MARRCAVGKEQRLPYAAGGCFPTTRCNRLAQRIRRLERQRFLTRAAGLL